MGEQGRTSLGLRTASKRYRRDDYFLNSHDMDSDREGILLACLKHMHHISAMTNNIIHTERHLFVRTKRPKGLVWLCSTLYWWPCVNAVPLLFLAGLEELF